MNRRQKNIRKELRIAGATSAEVETLLPLADNLRLLRNEDDSATNKSWFNYIVGLCAAPAAYVFIGIVVSSLILAFAQAVPPSSWLFPVQEASDNVAVRLRPEYREVVMMKRADQVNELVVSHASSQSDLRALANYTKVADAYKTDPHVNYAAFHYCASRLSQAAKMANPEVSQAIRNSLDSLDAS